MKIASPTRRFGVLLTYNDQIRQTFSSTMKSFQPKYRRYGEEKMWQHGKAKSQVLPIESNIA